MGEREREREREGRDLARRSQRVVAVTPPYCVGCVVSGAGCSGQSVECRGERIDSVVCRV